MVAGGIALALLLVLIAPVTGLRFGFPDAGTGSESLTSRRAYDLIADNFGPGANGPLVAVMKTGDPVALHHIVTRIAQVPGVAAVSAPLVNAAGDTAVITVTPTTGPQDEETERLLLTLRNDVVPGVAIGGPTAAAVDDSNYSGPRIPVFIGTVVALSFLLLLVVFRAPLVALKAAVMNLLAIGAAFGVMTVAVQGGWLGQLIGIDEPSPVPVFVPILLFAMLFGLSMDYEVLLLSRIREEYDRTGDSRSAVAEGVARTGRVITAAAAIMVTVFLAFVLEDLVMLKIAGLGMATAIFVDATLIRMVLVPSTMELLGKWNWWIPRWLDRLLPRLDIEGERGAIAGGDGKDQPVKEPVAA